MTPPDTSPLRQGDTDDVSDIDEPLNEKDAGSGLGPALPPRKNAARDKTSAEISVERKKTDEKYRN